MLTRPLMRQRITAGRLRPLFVDVDAAPLRLLAEQLVAAAGAGLGAPREDVEEALAAIAGAARQPLLARGLVKLLVDRMEFAEPAPEAIVARTALFQQALATRRSLPPGATTAEFETALAQALDRPLDAVRLGLFADLPQVRPLLAVDALTPRELLERYNLALAQTPLLGARRLTLRALAPELSRVRRLLRWLRFCRLVAEVRRDGEDWVLEVEGPGAVLALHKKYGLQLANFLIAVPQLERWQLTADVESKGRHALLELSDADPLVSPLSNALGWIPPELSTLAEGFADDPAWEVDLLPRSAAHRDGRALRPGPGAPRARHRARGRGRALPSLAQGRTGAAARGAPCPAGSRARPRGGPRPDAGCVGA